MRINKRLLSVNHTTGRSLHGVQCDVDAVVMHVVEGTMAGMRSWFNNPASNVSAHYGISFEGEIDQYVDEKDTAWANGRVHAPVSALVLARPNDNPNLWTVSIEHESTGRTDLTPKQRAASAWLVRDISRRHGFPLTRKHVIRHHEIYAKKTCPGAVNVDAVIDLALQEELPLRPPAPRLVWSNVAKSWLVVTQYNSDTDWRYQAVKNMVGTKATTPLSQMPSSRD